MTMTSAVCETPVDVFANLKAESEKAVSRQRAAARGGYEVGLSAVAFGDPLGDDQLAAFHQSRVAAGVTDCEMAEDLRQLRLFRDSCKKPLRADADVMAEIERVRHREDALREELKNLVARRVGLRAELELGTQTRCVRQADQLRARFSSLDFDALRQRLEIQDAKSKLPADYRPTPSAVLESMLSH
jgi:hypothetical protein